MNLNAEARVQLRVTMVVDADPDVGVPSLKVGGTWYACTWEAAAVEEPTGTWTRSALTDDLFAGPDYVDPDPGDVVLALGAHTMLGRVVTGSLEPVVFAGTLHVA